MNVLSLTYDYYLFAEMEKEKEKRQILAQQAQERRERIKMDRAVGCLD